MSVLDLVCNRIQICLDVGYLGGYPSPVVKRQDRKEEGGGVQESGGIQGGVVDVKGRGLDSQDLEL